MVNLTEEMKNMLKNQLPFLATTGKDGKPQVGPKGSLHVLGRPIIISRTTIWRRLRLLIEALKRDFALRERLIFMKQMTLLIRF